jgi:hypothetical protein
VTYVLFAVGPGRLGTVAKTRRKFWSLREAGREFGVHPQTVTRWVDRLGVPTQRVGNVRCIDTAGMHTLRRHFRPISVPA